MYSFLFSHKSTTLSNHTQPVWICCATPNAEPQEWTSIVVSRNTTISSLNVSWHKIADLQYNSEPQWKASSAFALSSVIMLSCHLTLGCLVIWHYIALSSCYFVICHCCFICHCVALSCVMLLCHYVALSPVILLCHFIMFLSSLLSPVILLCHAIVSVMVTLSFVIILPCHLTFSCHYVSVIITLSPVIMV